MFELLEKAEQILTRHYVLLFGIKLQAFPFILK